MTTEDESIHPQEEQSPKKDRQRLVKGKRPEKKGQEAEVQNVERPASEGYAGSLDGVEENGSSQPESCWTFDLPKQGTAARLRVGDQLTGSLHPGKILVLSHSHGAVGEIPPKMEKEMRRVSRRNILEGSVLRVGEQTVSVELCFARIEE